MDTRSPANGRRLTFLLRLFLAIIFITLTACNGSLAPTATSAPEPSSTPASEAGPLLVEVEFRAALTQPSPDNGKILLNILDEVTGLALNLVRYEMSLDDLDELYKVTLAFEPGTVVKYRFTREGATSAVEYNPLGEQVRYRMFRVDGPSMATDTISAWNDQPYSEETGRITGTLSNLEDGSPLASLLVTAAGTRTLTASDGTFVLEGLPVGVHNLFIYALDGAYSTFQQGAKIEAGKTTPAAISLAPSNYVNVTFNVTIPVENVVGLPIRMAGNLYQTGNTFSDLSGGLSVVSSRIPLLTQVGSGQYTITLALPAGADFNYKFTLGDGFWNSEQNSDGGFTLRKLIVPDTDITVEDTVATWHSGEAGPITFTVQAPANTPPGDFISIQFKPYGWTEPIPMWAMGNNQWLYILYSPLNMIPQMEYRYCRNGQCGSADEAAFSGEDSPGRPVTISQEPQTFQDSIEGWAWWQPSGTPTTVIAADIAARGMNFSAGFEFQSYYHPSMQLSFLPAFQSIRQIGSNWVVIDSSWSISSANPPIFEPLPGQDPLWADLVAVIQDGNNQGLQTAVFPIAHFTSAPEEWWVSASRDVYWWDAWFKRYKTFILHHADAAARANASALILGGEWISPALPGGLLADGTPSDVPEDASSRWGEIITAAREHFQGTILWAAPFSHDMDAIPDFIDQVDQIYLLWSPALSTDLDPAEASLEEEVASLLDEVLAPFQEINGKKIILAVNYPSANGSASGCIVDENSNCVPPERLSRPQTDVPGVTLDLQEQVDIYNAIFAAVNQRGWIGGIISRGYYFPAALQDKSASINGKPAQDVIWYWFPRMVSQ